MISIYLKFEQGSTYYHIACRYFVTIFLACCFKLKKNREETKINFSCTVTDRDERLALYSAPKTNNNNGVTRREREREREKKNFVFGMSAKRRKKEIFIAVCTSVAQKACVLACIAIEI